MLLFQGPRPWISIFSHLCHSSCLCISIFKCILGFVSVGKWAYSGQRSPVHARTPDVEVPLVNYPEGGEEVAFCQRRHVHIVDFCTWENTFTARRGIKTAKKAWWSGGAEENRLVKHQHPPTRHMRGQWEEMLTFLLLQYSKLSGIDNSAGDLQLDSFRFQPVKPG